MQNTSEQNDPYDESNSDMSPLPIENFSLFEGLDPVENVTFQKSTSSSDDKWTDHKLEFFKKEEDSDDMGDEWQEPKNLEEKRKLYKVSYLFLF